MRGIEKIKLEPGQSAEVFIRLAVNDLAWYDGANKKWQVEKMDNELYLGGSSDNNSLLKTTFTID